jgi:hypothetical protein
MQQTLQNDLIAAAGVTKPIIFYDDVCVMCNGFVNLMLSIDRRQQFLFAPLGGEISRRILPPLPEDPGDWSMIYVDEAGIHDQSDASLALEPGAIRPALDPEPGLSSARPQSVSLVRQARHVPAADRGRESAFSRLSREFRRMSNTSGVHRETSSIHD